MKRPHVMFTGTGRAVPKRIMTNHDFAAIGIETDDAWIIDRTGIRQVESVTGTTRDIAHSGNGLAAIRLEGDW